MLPHAFCLASPEYLHSPHRALKTFLRTCLYDTTWRDDAMLGYNGTSSAPVGLCPGRDIKQARFTNGITFMVRDALTS